MTAGQQCSFAALGTLEPVITEAGPLLNRTARQLIVSVLFHVEQIIFSCSPTKRQVGLNAKWRDLFPPPDYAHRGGSIDATERP